MKRDNDHLEDYMQLVCVVDSLRNLKNTLKTEIHKKHCEDALQSLLKIKLQLSERKLVIFDLNEVLCERIYNTNQIEEGCPLPNMVGKFKVWVRPDPNGWMKRVFEQYDVAVWSSAKFFNIEQLIPLIFEPSVSSQLKFIFSQSQCMCIMDKDAPKSNVLVKSLSRVWEEFPQYDSTNTYLIDNCKEKQQLNPPECQIIPERWTRFLQNSPLDDIPLPQPLAVVNLN
jgi:hypothetical protein